MVTVRPEREKDIPVIREVVTQAFGQELEADLVDRLRKRKDFDRRLSLVAEERKEIVGHVLFSQVEVHDDGTVHKVLCLASMSVRPDRQRRGIGMLMTVEGIEKCRKLGHKVIVVIGHPTYYPRFGFEPARPRGLKQTYGAPSEAWMVLELETGALDGMRGTVVFPKEFEGV